MSSVNQTKARCIEPGCEEIAGTPWTPLWCPKHDQERRDRITKQFDDIAASMGIPTADKGNKPT